MYPSYQITTMNSSCGVKITTLADGNLCLKGNTFPYKDGIKTAGGKWNPAEKAWTIPATADLSFIQPIAPPPLPSHPWFACCEKARVVCFGRQEYICKEHNVRPWWICCDKGRIVRVQDMSCSCETHDFRVRGARYTGD